MSCFDKMKQYGREIEEGVRKLQKTWESPHLVMRGYGENVDEASKHLENFLISMKEINDGLLEDIKPMTKYFTDMDRFLGECHSIFDELKDQCNDIDTLLTEYGYVSPIETSDESEVDNLDSSILSLKSVESLTISSPGNFGIKETDEEDRENVSPIQVIYEAKPKCIQTPVIKSLASVQGSELKIQKSQNHLVTPSRKFPQEPLYSPYYYNHK